MSRIKDVPVYAEHDSQVSAKLYNLWRRVRLHLALPIRLKLLEHEGVVLLLEEQAWVCVDERNNDMPILAWLMFEDKNRDALHVPIDCRLNYYHFTAPRLCEPALSWMESELDRLLCEEQGEQGGH